MASNADECIVYKLKTYLNMLIFKADFKAYKCGWLVVGLAGWMAGWFD